MDGSTFPKMETKLGTIAHISSPQPKKILRKKFIFQTLLKLSEKLAQVKTNLPWWAKPISSKFLEFYENLPKSVI